MEHESILLSLHNPFTYFHIIAFSLHHSKFAAFVDQHIIGRQRFCPSASCLDFSGGYLVFAQEKSGVAEVLPHAIKVDFWDIHEFSNKVISILDNPGLGIRLLRNSQADLKKLLWNNSVNAIISSYHKASKGVIV